MALCSLLTYLAFLGGDSGIPGNQFSEHSTKCFNTQRQWCHIQQQYILDVTRENTSLNSGTHGYSLIWINSLAGGSAKYFLYSGLHLSTTYSALISWCKFQMLWLWMCVQCSWYCLHLSILIKYIYSVHEHVHVARCYDSVYWRFNAYLGHSGHSTNQQNITNIAFIDVSIPQTFLAWFHSPLNEITDKGFKLWTCKFHGQVLWTTGINSDVRQVDVCL